MLHAELMQCLAETLKAGRTAALVTVVSKQGSAPRETGAKMVVFAGGSILGTIGGGRLEAQATLDAVAALHAGESRSVSYELEPKQLGMYCAGKVDLFIDVFADPLKLVVLGGGHVGERVSELAGFLGLPHAVVDDRPEFARPERFPRARQALCAQPDEALQRVGVDSKTAVVIVTRCHGFDLRCLAGALRTPAFYIGMIGSRTKTARLFELCRRRGLEPQADPRVHAPVGLDLGGRTPEAVALSILAEVLMVRHGAAGGSMRLREEAHAGHG